MVNGPTIIAFFPPGSKSDLEKDPDLNETLADFQVYANRVREPLKKSGIGFRELYTRSFQTRLGKKVTTFRPLKDEVGYYLVAPGKKPRIERGVLTDQDLLDIARDYFGLGK